jgi:hypothetical protein
MIEGYGTMLEMVIINIAGAASNFVKKRQESRFLVANPGKKSFVFSLTKSSQLSGV